MDNNYNFNGNNNFNYNEDNLNSSYSNQPVNNDIYRQNGFEPPKRGSIKGFDIDKILNDSTLLKIMAVKGIVSSIIMIFVCITAFRSGLFDSMIESKDPVMETFSHGFKTLLLIFIVMGALSLIRHGLSLYIQISGNEDTRWGRKYLLLTSVLSANVQRLFQLVMGGLFVAFSLFAFIDGPNMLAEGNTVTELYIVSGIFTLAGLGLVISAVIGIIRSIRYYLEKLREEDMY
ncbi:MAG TPA: hypothetical protein DCP07_00470 [Lachnospiraceae bacterium]|nr:hypothetical protein [Lachnospiraceae bacterium]